MAGFIQIGSTGNPWPLLAGLGLAALFIGGLLLLFPLQSLRLIFSLFGIVSLLTGFILLAQAAKMVQAGSMAFLVALIPAICALVLGAVVFTNPGLVEAFFAMILGFACLIAGLVAAGAGIFHEAPRLMRILSLASGFLLAGIGFMFLIDPQGAAGFALQVAGLLLAAGGVVLLAMGIRARYQRNPLENPEFRVIDEG
jgi:uncharacterized membrane protein HdeD (DUF308 family)